MTSKEQKQQWMGNIDVDRVWRSFSGLCAHWAVRIGEDDFPLADGTTKTAPRIHLNPGDEESTDAILAGLEQEVKVQGVSSVVTLEGETAANRLADFRRRAWKIWLTPGSYYLQYGFEPLVHHFTDEFTHDLADV